MKLRKNVALLVFGLVIVLGSNAHAIPLAGTVNPGIAPGYSFANSTTGTALFSFTNIDNGTGLVAQSITLTLESDVFNLTNTSTSINAPAGWSVTSFSFGDRFDQLTGPGLVEGDVLQFTMNYTLLDNAKALQNSGAWSEGGPWQIGYSAQYANLPFSTGGSTIMNPEPGTILLMGSGLLGLGLWRWKQKRK